MSLSAIIFFHYKLSIMEIYQIALMVIGSITLLWLVVKVVKGIFWFLEAGMESCFREKYPYDFEMHLEWIIKELESRGYEQTQTIDAGGDYPGVILNNPQTGTEMEVRLRAPLLTTTGYSIVVANHKHKTAIVMQDSASDENKRLLKKYLE